MPPHSVPLCFHPFLAMSMPFLSRPLSGPSRHPNHSFSILLPSAPPCHNLLVPLPLSPTPASLCHRSTVKIMASPDYYAADSFSGVLVRVPSYTGARTGSEHAESWFYGQARILFSTKGYKEQWSQPRAFVLVEYYMRETAKGAKVQVRCDYKSPFPSVEELNLPTR